MTKLRQNILDQPAELLRSLRHNLGPGRAQLDEAAKLIRGAEQVFITGIGSSWHAGMAVQSFLQAAGRAAGLVDASELLHYVRFPPKSVLIALSRSGKSVEIVRLMEKSGKSNVPVIAVTNTPDSPLARGAGVMLRLEAAFDHCVSISMYSGLGLVGGLATALASGAEIEALSDPLEQILKSAGQRLPQWQERIERSGWLDGDAAHYFLARGASAASAYETRLLWEELPKRPQAR